MGQTNVGGGYVINDPAYGGAPHFYRDYNFQTPAFTSGNDPNDIDYNDLIQGRVTFTNGPRPPSYTDAEVAAFNAGVPQYEARGSGNAQTFMGQYPAAGTPYGNASAGTPAQVGSQVPLPGGGMGPMTQEMYDLYNQPLSQEMIDAYNNALGITGSVPQPAGSPGGPGGPPLTPLGPAPTGGMPYIPSAGDPFQGANVTGQTPADQGTPYIPSASDPFQAAGSMPPSPGGGGPYAGGSMSPGDGGPFAGDRFDYDVGGLNPYAPDVGGQQQQSLMGNPYLQQAEENQNPQQPQGGLYSGLV
jgi:hypothetical protein